MLFAIEHRKLNQSKINQFIYYTILNVNPIPGAAGDFKR